MKARGLLLGILVGTGSWWMLARWPGKPAVDSSIGAASGREPRLVHYCILFGFGDREPTRWDGSIEATGARIHDVELWYSMPDASVEGNAWKLTTRGVQLTRGEQPTQRQPLFENGVYVRAELLDSNPEFRVQTAQGEFRFRAGDIRWGKAGTFLGNRVRVEQIPVAHRVTDSIEEEDFPALAVGQGRLYLAYVRFTHGDRSREWPRQLRERPKSFEDLARPVGGDQVWLREYSLATGQWSEPVPVTPNGQDIYRVAVAVDGQGRVWVIWSAQVNGNFDLYARARQAGRWSTPLRLTTDPGPDLSPVAVTDSSGAVWVAWQGYRKNFEILVTRQLGEKFAPEQPVSISTASDWSPQIAAGPGGEVAVAWDTYDKGDYDVYLRRLRYSGRITMEDPLPVAASPRFEARPSLAYDPAGKIWVAYEEGPSGWGKDFGAYETTGMGLYQAARVRLKVVDGRGLYAPEPGPEPLLAVVPATHPLNPRVRGRKAAFLESPDPSLAQNRPPNRTPYQPGYPRTGMPRVAISPDGTVFLAYRTDVGGIWGPLGTSWFENVVYFDGKEWVGPIFVGHTDAVLDMRPAVVALEPGRLLMAGSSDHRFSLAEVARRRGRDLFHYDVYLFDLAAGRPIGPPRFQGLPSEAPAGPAPDVQAEREQVARMRAYQVELKTAKGTEKLRLIRGEFHRHTEISGDGGNDGPLIDAWRYFIDAASMDWAGCCDHDNGGGREYSWWITQKMTDAFLLPGQFTPMFSYERSVRYPEGHRNVVFARRGIRPLPRLPKMADDSPPEPAPDTQMLYAYLRRFGGIVASHTSGTNMGTDWRDNDPEVEPVVEIYQGDRQNYEMPGAPRSNSEKDSIGGWRPQGFVSNALAKGYRLGFQASSDHISTHMSYCNIWVRDMSREAVLEGLKKRRVYGATDNIIAGFWCGDHFMGEEFTASSAPEFRVKLIGTAPFARVHVIKDGRYVYTASPGTREVSFYWKDAEFQRGKTSYYYVRGEQEDGELVWVSPIWVRAE